MIGELHEILHGQVLRAAINTGNRALVQQDGATLQGVSPALARRLAAQLGVALEPVIYPGAGRVFDDAEQGRWDVAFLAVDPQRAERVSFTRPYHTIEATYAVRSDASFSEIVDADRAGVQILTSTGSAYDLHLRSSLRSADLLHSGTPPESFAEFRDGRGDLVAGVRASLERAFGADPEFRVLPGVLTRVAQAMVLPGPRNPQIHALDHFVAGAIADGTLPGICRDKAPSVGRTHTRTPGKTQQDQPEACRGVRLWWPTSLVSLGHGFGARPGSSGKSSVRIARANQR